MRAVSRSIDVAIGILLGESPKAYSAGRGAPMPRVMGAARDQALASTQAQTGMVSVESTMP
jgi:hypothetical protein